MNVCKKKIKVKEEEEMSVQCELFFSWCRYNLRLKKFKIKKFYNFKRFKHSCGAFHPFLCIKNHIQLKIYPKSSYFYNFYCNVNACSFSHTNSPLALQCALCSVEKSTQWTRNCTTNRKSYRNFSHWIIQFLW